MTWKSVQSIMIKKTSELNSFASNIKPLSISQSLDILIDLSEVTKVDMCALALILELEKKIKVLSKGNIFFCLHWSNIPPDLTSLADLCGLTEDLDFK